MPIKPSSLPRAATRPDGIRNDAGAALMIVLSLIVLLSGILVLFLQMTGGLRQTTHRLAEQERSRQLALLATDEVISQISEGTSGVNAARVTDNVWVSQPGMLRVFNQNGSLRTAYKLYSAENPLVTEESDLVESVASDTPTDWRSRPHEFVDINAPNGSGEYPILHPATPQQADGVSLGGPGGAEPSTADVGMPVRWWYLKRDGTFSPTMTADVVGRVAWWTDDETTKLNVNTASEGSYFSEPYNEYEMAQLPRASGSSPVPYVPTTYEYNAMPSHPAATSLSPALRGVFPSAPNLSALLVNAAPFLQWGGTEGMTKNSLTRYELRFTQGFVPVTLKQDSLYTSVSDYFIRHLENGNFSTSNEAQAASQRARFVMTHHSAGNNLNPFGQPRLSLWPIPRQETHRSFFDEQIRLASTYAGKEYVFTRRNPSTRGGGNGGAHTSAIATSDFPTGNAHRNFVLYDQFLRPSTTGSKAIPGYPTTTSLGAKYNANRDWNYTLAGIMGYLRVTNLIDPLLAGNSGMEGADQSVPIQYDPAITYVTNAATTTTGAGRYYDSLYSTSGTSLKGLSGQVYPLKIYGTQSFGRVPLVTKAAVHIFLDSELPATSQYEIGVALYFELTVPVLGFPVMFPLVDLELATTNLRFSVTDQTGASTSHAVSIGGTVSTLVPNGATGWAHPFRAGGPLGMAMLIDPTEGFYPIHPTRAYPFYGKFTLPKSLWDPTGPLQSTIQLDTTVANLILRGQPGDMVYRRTLQFEFPATPAFSLPYFGRPDAERHPRSFAQRLNDDVTTSPYPSGSFQPSPLLMGVNDPLPPPPAPPLPNQDIVRQLELSHGDYRILAYAETEDDIKRMFAKHRDYDDASVRQAHSLRPRANRQYAFDAASVVQGKLLTSLNYPVPSPFKSNQNLPYLFDVTNLPDLPSSFRTGFPSSQWARDFATPPLSTIRADETGLIQEGPWLLRGLEPSFAAARKSGEYQRLAKGLFTPYLQVPSPVVLGTLPSRVGTALQDPSSGAWQTLLFAPNPLGPISGAHEGLAGPKDHLLLNFFQMPVVDPFPITLPGSTLGQVNLNQQIIPFTQFQRTTALHGLLKGMMMHAIPQTVPNYKTTSLTIRHPLNVAETLTSLTGRYGNSLDVYRHPSEICEVFLVPSTPSSSPTASSIASWWDDYQLTGDNLRELPYSYLYPRVTTQSNTYRVHIIAQSLTPAFGRHPNAPDGGQAYVSGEWRGSMLVERQLDSGKVRDALNASGSAALDPDKHSLHPYFTSRITEIELFR